MSHFTAFHIISKSIFKTSDFKFVLAPKFQTKVVLWIFTPLCLGLRLVFTLALYYPNRRICVGAFPSACFDAHQEVSHRRIMMETHMIQISFHAHFPMIRITLGWKHDLCCSNP